jgi:hypothetical protein
MYRCIQRDATVLSWFLFQETYMFLALTIVFKVTRINRSSKKRNIHGARGEKRENILI